MKRIECRATYNPSTTAATIGSWFNAKISPYEGDEITGFMILNEGEVWITLEGPATVINNERDDLADDTLFTDFDVLNEELITSRLLNRTYFYNEMVRPKGTTPL